MNPTVANSAWLAGCIREFARFQRATRRVECAQQGILRRILSANAETEFGRAHGFSSIRSLAEYRQRVPLSDYESCFGSIQCIASGAQNVLTADPIQLFEPTSGSSGSEKWVPYNNSLQREFQAGIRAWIADLFLHEPSLMRGAAYWSVSPVTEANRKTSGGIPIGFAEDAAYLGDWQKRLVNAVLAVPGAVRGIPDMETFRYVTLLFLVSSGNLRLISVWNPSFLSLLVARLPEWGDRLAHDVERGRISVQLPIPHELSSAFHANPSRAGEIRAAMKTLDAAAMHQRLWPKLRLLSCWTDANASAPAKLLETFFPQARVQGKGLLATEAFVSFPLHGHPGAALAICSHFLEFLPADDSGCCDPDNPRAAHELEIGQRYTVVLTTGGGLYRYQLHDVIEVIDHLHDCPMIRFLGRQSYISDWYGEKLNEAHVSVILRKVLEELAISPEFAMVACDAERPEPGYVLYVESSASEEILHRAAANIEARLQENFHYNYARKLGQLAALRVFRAGGAAESFLAEKNRLGQRAGAVKQAALDSGGNWSQVFQGEFLAETSCTATGQ